MSESNPPHSDCEDAPANNDPREPPDLARTAADLPPLSKADFWAQCVDGT